MSFRLSGVAASSQQRVRTSVWRLKPLRYQSLLPLRFSVFFKGPSAPQQLDRSPGCLNSASTPRQAVVGMHSCWVEGILTTCREQPTAAQAHRIHTCSCHLPVQDSPRSLQTSRRQPSLFLGQLPLSQWVPRWRGPTSLASSSLQPLSTSIWRSSTRCHCQHWMEATWHSF